MRAVLLILVLVCGAPCLAFSQVSRLTPAPVVDRLHVANGALYDRWGARVVLVGENMDNDDIGVDPATGQTLFEMDAEEMDRLGLNTARFIPRWYNDPSGVCATSYPNTRDGYDPTGASHGYLTTAFIANIDAWVYTMSAHRKWMILDSFGGACDFYTLAGAAWTGANGNTIMWGRHAAMVAFLAARYAAVPYIGCYGLMAEPSPVTTRHADQFANDLVVAAEEVDMAAVRAVDPVTPICPGPAKNYNLRDVGAFSLPDWSNWFQQADGYELGGLGNASDPGYVFQAKSFSTPTVQPAVIGGYHGYPASYNDDKGGDTGPTCSFEPGYSGGPVDMTQAWLLTTLQKCIDNYTAASGVPVVVTQIGVPSLTPDAWEYTRDFTANLNSKHDGWVLWTMRSAATATTPSDGTNGITNTSSGAQGLFYQSSIGGAWAIKDSTYFCADQDQGVTDDGGVEAVSRCHDWATMIATQAAAR